MKKIILANPRGFCAGVDRAITIVEKALEKYGAPVYVRHEVVHTDYAAEAFRPAARDRSARTYEPAPASSAKGAQPAAAVPYPLASIFPDRSLPQHTAPDQWSQRYAARWLPCRRWPRLWRLLQEYSQAPAHSAQAVRLPSRDHDDRAIMPPHSRPPESGAVPFHSLFRAVQAHLYTSDTCAATAAVLHAGCAREALK